MEHVGISWEYEVGKFVIYGYNLVGESSKRNYKYLRIF